MSTRRSKRKPVNQSQKESNEGAASKKSRKLPVKATKDEKTKEDQPSRTSAGRKSARRSLAPVSYQEDGNDSEDDFKDSRGKSEDTDDPEYNASGGDDDDDDDQDEQSSKEKGSSTQVRKVTKRGLLQEVEDKKSSSEESDSLDDGKNRKVFEVSKLQTEINLSSDDDSGDEEDATFGHKGNVKTGGDVTDTRLPYFPPGKRKDVGKGSEDGNGAMEGKERRDKHSLSSEGNGNTEEEKVGKEGKSGEGKISLSSDEDSSTEDVVSEKGHRVNVEPDKPSTSHSAPQKNVNQESTEIKGAIKHETHDSEAINFLSDGDVSRNKGAADKETENPEVVSGKSAYFSPEENAKEKAKHSSRQEQFKLSKDGLRVKALSKKLKQRHSLFNDSDAESNDGIALGEKSQLTTTKSTLNEPSPGSSKVKLEDQSGEGMVGESDQEEAKVKKKVVHDKATAAKKRKAAIEKSEVIPRDVDMKAKEVDIKGKKRPRRACRKSPVKSAGKLKIRERGGASAQESKAAGASVLTKKGADRGKTSKEGHSVKKEPSVVVNEVTIVGDDSDSESSEDEWEDVEDVNVDGTPRKKKPDDKPTTSVVEIDIELPGTESRRKKAYDWADYYRRELNKIRKERQIVLHKVHLLCLLANGFHRNKVCSDDLLLSTALSIIPPDVAKARPKKLNMNFVYKLLFWYRKHFGVNTSLPRSHKFPVFQLLQGMQTGVFSSEEEFVMVFVLCIRSLWGEARLVISFQPITWKAEIIEKNPKGKKSKQTSPKSAPTSSPPSTKTKSSGKSGSRQTPKSVASANKVKTTDMNVDRKDLKSSMESKQADDSKTLSAKQPASSKRTKNESRTSDSNKRNLMNDGESGPERKTLRKLKKGDHAPMTFQQESSTKAVPKSSEKKVASAGNIVRKSRKSSKVKREEYSDHLDVTPRRKARERSDSKKSSNKRAAQLSTNVENGKVRRITDQDDISEDDDFKDDAVPPEGGSKGRNRHSGMGAGKHSRISAGKSAQKKKSDGRRNSMESDKKDERIEDQSKRSVRGDRSSTQEKSVSAKNRRSRSIVRNGPSGGGGKVDRQSRLDQEDETMNHKSERDTSKRLLRKRKATKKPPRPKEQSSDDDGDGGEEFSDEGSNYSEDEWIHQKKTSRKKKKKRSLGSPNTSKGSMDSMISSDSDFEDEIETLSMNCPRSACKPVKPLKKNGSMLLSDSEQSVQEVKSNKEKKGEGVDVWCEVFVPAHDIWVSVDCMQGYVNKPHEIETRATQPLLYVLGFDNDHSIKDLTQRYASRWMSHNIKMRVAEDWWLDTLTPYRSKKKKREENEDAKMQTQQLDQPLPKSIVEYKNHPLYALERHLLKFEAIYPPSAAVLGYCRGEPVYSRECVHTLKSRQTWMKEGQSVKDGEKPYKLVKKLINPFKKHLMTPEEQNQMLDIYGEWQTELYVPPPAKDGIVPRNEYGNVELFKPSMLPKGTVHLKIPGLNKVASKLDIDCAPAMMGWEFHKRFACPILDGFVVCEEVADVLVAAWEEEQVEIEKKRKLKKEQKAMKNWKQLIKSLLIRERLKDKYQLEEEPPPSGQGKGKGKGKKTKAHWPENKMTSFKGDASNLLPFEKKSDES